MRAIEHINKDRDAPDYQSPSNLRVVDFPSTAASYAAKAREAHAEAMAALTDALSCLAEACLRADEVCSVAGPSVLGVGAHQRLDRLAKHIATELKQIAALRTK